jgi:hypothetical protein
MKDKTKKFDMSLDELSILRMLLHKLGEQVETEEAGTLAPLASKLGSEVGCIMQKVYIFTSKK